MKTITIGIMDIIIVVKIVIVVVIVVIIKSSSSSTTTIAATAAAPPIPFFNTSYLNTSRRRFGFSMARLNLRRTLDYRVQKECQ